MGTLPLLFILEAFFILVSRWPLVGRSLAVRCLCVGLVVAIVNVMSNTLVSVSVATVPLLVALNVANPYFSSRRLADLYSCCDNPHSLWSPTNAWPGISPPIDKPSVRLARWAIKASRANALWSRSSSRVASDRISLTKPATDQPTFPPISRTRSDSRNPAARMRPGSFTLDRMP